jgi:hypothetical protein
MKKTLHIVLWMVAFLLLGSSIFAVIGTPLLYCIHKTPQLSDWLILTAVLILAAVLSIGSLALGLVLGIRGRLPGTRRD